MRRVAVVLVGALGCGLPDVNHEGVHVRVAADPGRELCGGSMDHMDAFVARVAEEFGVTPPTGDRRIVFHWVTEEDYGRRSGCPVGSTGCFSHGEVFAMSAPLNHELVHALASVFGRKPPFFEEGLAVAYQGLGSEWYWQAWFPSSVDRSLTVSTPQSLDYGTAGAFVRFLIDEHGIEAVLAMMGELWYYADRAQIEAGFLEALGVSIADSIAAYEGFRAVCPEAERTALWLECEAPEVVWDGVAFAEHRRLACDQDDAVGPYDGQDVMVFRTLEISEGGIYELRSISEDPAFTVSLVACGGCEPRRFVTAYEGGGAFELTQGRYALRLHGSALAERDVGWAIQRR